MKSAAVTNEKDDIAAAFDEALSVDPHLLILFAAPDLLRDDAALAFIREKSEGRLLIGCSTAGEIAKTGTVSGGLSLMGLHFHGTKAQVASQLLLGTQDSVSAGEALAEQLKAPDLKAAFILSPGANVNGSELIFGMNKVLGRDVVLSGGLAGDELRFKETNTICNGELFTNRIVAAGFYGDRVVVSCGSEGGWRPFGPARRVTKAHGNLLQELDGKPALQLYRQYLGEKAQQLPASGLSYPFAILRDDRTMSGVIRSALDIDLKNETLVMAGDVPQGSQVCLMHADTEALIQGAAQAAAEALRTHAGPIENGCALLVNCIGRRAVLGIDTDEEIEAVVDSFLPQTPIAGFYSYGEFSFHPRSGKAELHNQTMSITYITEREGE